MSDIKVEPFIKRPVGRPKQEKKEIKVKTYVKRPVGRPKKEKSDATFDQKAYMKAYMKRYNQDNKVAQLHRRNTSYYVNKFNIPKDYLDKYGIYTARMYKITEELKKFKAECPMFLEDVKEIIKGLEKKNHVADLSGVEVLTEIE
jgi:hypothetical protein